MRILVVEDDPLISKALSRVLTKEGYAIDIANTGGSALELAAQHSYDAIVLDVVIPEPNGIEVCKTLRAMGTWSPVLMLTGLVGTGAKVEGLDAGADDYLAKPFAPPELLARLRALIRRQSTDLGPREFSLLELFIRNAGRAMSRRTLLEAVWGYTYTSNVVDVYVAYLREKIDKPFGTTTIETVRGIGYRLGRSRTADAQPL
jgi:two-component system OmpR family response regulator